MRYIVFRFSYLIVTSIKIFGIPNKKDGEAL